MANKTAALMRLKEWKERRKLRALQKGVRMKVDNLARRRE